MTLNNQKLFTLTKGVYECSAEANRISEELQRIQKNLWIARDKLDEAVRKRDVYLRELGMEVAQDAD